jgi:hypothetical protein
MAFLTESLITHLTALRVVTTMYVLMSDKTALMTEFLITHLTAIRMITTMYASMCYQMAFFD